MVYSRLQVHPWIARSPNCTEARPPCCPACTAPSLPPGRPFVVVGHGLRERQVLGPTTANGPPESLTVTARRYRCRACEAVFAVVPRGLLARRWYGGIAIAQALARVVQGEPAGAVRKAISPFVWLGHSARRGWKQLGVWLACAPRLFWLQRPVPDVQGVLAHLTSRVPTPEKASQLERIVAGVVSIGSE
jgi:hypothetical protein